jgi:serine/threonine protein kinase
VSSGEKSKKSHQTTLSPQDTVALPELPASLEPITGAKQGLPLIQGYDIVAKLGAGAMGEVFHARQRSSGREVALKIMAERLLDSPEFVKRFEREIQLLSRLDHPNIAPALTHGSHDGRVYMTMEFVRGPDLGMVLKSQGPFPEADVLRMAIQIARALEYVHDTAGLIHRDIKPGNLLVITAPKGESGGETIKIIDFGLARSTIDEDQNMTLTGMIMGTPYYMSPEQIRGERNLSIHTDIYALGATMYHLLTGAVPYDGKSQAMVMSGHLNSPVPDPGALMPNLSRATRYLIMTAMSKLAQKRFVNYPAFIACCERALQSLQIQAGSIKILRKPMTKSVRSRPNSSDNTVVDPFKAEAAAQQSAKPAHQAAMAKEETTFLPHPSPNTSEHFDDALIGTGVHAKMPLGGSDALHKVQTDKIRRIQTTARIRRFQTARAMRDGTVVDNVNSPVLAVQHDDSLLVPFALLVAQLVGLFTLFVL